MNIHKHKDCIYWIPTETCKKNCSKGFLHYGGGTQLSKSCPTEVLWLDSQLTFRTWRVPWCRLNEFWPSVIPNNISTMSHRTRDLENGMIFIYQNVVRMRMTTEGSKGQRSHVHVPRQCWHLQTVELFPETMLFSCHDQKASWWRNTYTLKHLPQRLYLPQWWSEVFFSNHC